MRHSPGAPESRSVSRVYSAIPSLAHAMHRGCGALRIASDRLLVMGMGVAGPR